MLTSRGAELLKITPETFIALARPAERAFVEKLAEVLRSAVPALAGEAQEPFLAQVRLLIERARDYGFESEQAIGSFAVSAGLLGVDFVDHIPAAREILESGADEERKAEQLENFTVALFEALEE